MELVINKCYGGFGLSDRAIKEILNRKGKSAYFYKQTKYEFEHGNTEYIKVGEGSGGMFVHVLTKDLGEKTNDIDSVDAKHYFWAHNLERSDPDLVAVVKELGEEANGQFAELRVVEIPDDLGYYIDEHDGIESIHENHKSWG